MDISIKDIKVMEILDEEDDVAIRNINLKEAKILVKLIRNILDAEPFQDEFVGESGVRIDSVGSIKIIGTSHEIGKSKMRSFYRR